LATFQAQVEGLTGLSIGTSPTTGELTQFLNDAVTEVTNRIIFLKPNDALKFTRVTSELTSNGQDVNGADIISVVREDGVVNSWRECRQVSSAKQSRVVDVESLDYASKYNPAYIRWNDGTITVYPAPTSSPNRYKIFYVNNVPTFSGGSNTYDSDTIHYFPNDKVYLVILNTSLKSLQNAMSAKTLPSDITLPVLSEYSETLPTFTAPNDLVVPVPPANIDVDFTDVTSVPSFIKPIFSAPTHNLDSLTMNLPVAPSISANTITITGTAPTYTAPVLSLDTKPTITDLTIATVIPVPPTLESIPISTSTGTNPTFTPPVMNAPDWSDVNNWISVEEDSEMSTARVDEIATKITEYNARLSEAQIAFNEESTILNKDLEIAIQNADIHESSKLTKYASELESYKESVNKEIEEWDSNYTKELALWQQNNASILQKYQLDIQNELNKFNKEVVEYQSKMQKDIEDGRLAESKDSRNLQVYQADLNKEVQRFGSEVINKDLEIWKTNYEQQVTSYTADIQNETQRITAFVQNFRAEMDKAISSYELETGLDLGIYQSEIQSNVQKFQADLAKKQSTFDTSMAKYLNEFQRVTGANQNKIEKLNSEIQNYIAQINKSSVDYQWMQERYLALKQQYDEAFIMMAPQQQQQQARR
tara:strand:+ start:253 stop:2202 length:1950 start_codon:yes stop_codon:yes gene_type:complete